MTVDPQEISQSVVKRLRTESKNLRTTFGPSEPGGRVRCCWVDDLLPEELLIAAFHEMPLLTSMVRRQNLKERKYVTAQLNQLGKSIVSLVTAFNNQDMADAIAGIMGKPRLEIDPRLYNGGITAMVPGDFMCPHLDNSHDHDRVRRREVVLLYYFSPHWRSGYGGDLELWDNDGTALPRAVEYKRNRLVVMETTDHSWHSIRPIVGPMPRVNVTSYYYAPRSEQSPLRLTRFASWPEQKMRGMLFRSEFHMRSLAVQALGGRRLRPNLHAYSAPLQSGSPHPD